MTRIKRLRGNQRQSQVAQREDLNDRDGEELSEDFSSSCQEDLDFLKVAVIDEANMDIIKSKLIATSEYRRHLITTNHSIDLLENFPYFFYNHKLVCCVMIITVIMKYVRTY